LLRNGSSFDGFAFCKYYEITLSKEIPPLYSAKRIILQIEKERQDNHIIS